METKTIIFEGGPLHNQFRVVEENVDKFYVSILIGTQISSRETKHLSDKEIQTKRVCYIKCSTLYNGFECFVYKKDLDEDLKPTENESDQKGTETV